MNPAGPNSGRAPDARSAALDLLAIGARSRQPARYSALTHSADMAALSPRDRAFARLLVTTVLRRRGQIDAAIEEKLSRPLAKRQNQVRNALRLGIAQLAFLGTPAHAAVDSSVKLVRQRGRSGMTGLVNAVLRAIDRDSAAALAATPEGRANVIRQTGCGKVGGQPTAPIPPPPSWPPIAPSRRSISRSRQANRLTYGRSGSMRVSCRPGPCGGPPVVW